MNVLHWLLPALNIFMAGVNTAIVILAVADGRRLPWFNFGMIPVSLIVAAGCFGVTA